MIHIDADQGEGGGQILRTALALSAVRGVPVRLSGIRARRKAPGLRAQHLTAVGALAQICRAEVQGAGLGSRDLTFAPRAVRAGQYRFDVGTAGSIALTLQALLLPLALAEGPSRVLLTGGTHVPWSPPADYLQEILLPRLAQMGIRATAAVERCGFYPRGGGRILVEIPGGDSPVPLTLAYRSGRPVVRGFSGVAGLAASVAEEQRALALERLARAGHRAEIAIREMRAADPGSVLFLAAQDEVGSGGFTGLGTPGSDPGRIAADTVDALLDFAGSAAACDPYLADQLVVPMALASGTSRVTTSRVTPHLVTAVAVAQQILGCPVQVRGEVGAPGSVTIEGAGAARAQAVFEAPAGRGAEATAGAPILRKARAADGPAIQALLAHFAARGELLHRTLNEVYQHLRDFVVCEADGQIVGVCALWLYWEDLAEVRSLAVHEAYGGRGVGTTLVQACLDEAAALGIKRVFALTYRPGFFERLGFRTLDKRELPQKIWKDCIRCAKFTCCDEVALIREVAPAAAPPDGGAGGTGAKAGAARP
jgi:RNA 3'-terminal phosphate cyclase (ATP)